MGFMDLGSNPQPSFQYDGRPSAEFWDEWPCETATELSPGGRVVCETRTDPDTGLRVRTRVRRFDDCPAVDWVVEFENGGSADTPILEDILPLDLATPMPKTESLWLHHANGSLCRMDDFLPQTTKLPPRSEKTLAPEGGRSSDGVLPFMNLQRRGCGVVVAIGWSGRWSATFKREWEAARLRAGMERVHLRLHSGEKIRTPRILLVPWEGDDPATGTNAFRRVLMAHYLPRVNGQLTMPVAAQCLQSYFYRTGEAGEHLDMAALPKVAATGADTYWIDACWYGDGDEWWEEVGSWTVNRDRFPNGLRPISDAAHEAGMRFVLWFEPERARKKSAIAREHPEFLLSSDTDPDNLLLNLGMPEAREYIIEVISTHIAEQGIDVYRQDFNFDPLPYWQAADESDRIGMTEIRHTEGLYAFWDDLLRRHPNISIDNCSSGGRRIDLETMTRSLPLWPSDYPDIVGPPNGLQFHTGEQCLNAGLARWIPLFGGGLWNFTPYSSRGEIIGGFSFGMHLNREDFPPDDTDEVVWAKDMLAKGKTILMDGFPVDGVTAAIKEWRGIRDFFLGDFYLLLPLTVSAHDWCAWQFHREDLDAGVAAFFRRHASPFPAMRVELKAIDPAGAYDVSLSSGYDEAPRTRMTGAELALMDIEIPETCGSVLLRYTRAQNRA